MTIHHRVWTAMDFLLMAEKLLSHLSVPLFHHSLHPHLLAYMKSNGTYKKNN